MLQRLARAEYAGFNPFKKTSSTPLICLKGTRVNILHQIQDWGEGHSKDSIFWLNGMAGTGKSTIARTVAHHFYEKGRLGASFFFSRSEKGLSNASALCTTLAIQLSEVLPNLKPYICAYIREHSSTGEQSLQEQWTHLVLHPLMMLEKNILSSLVLVIVIDALDECESSNDIIHPVLQLITDLRDLQVVQFRILITSRPEEKIRLGFRKVAHRKLILDKVDPDNIKADISTFFIHELQKIKEYRSMENDWPGQGNIDKLVQKAGLLFIFAATACRFLSASPFPESNLLKLLQDNSTSSSATKELDKMYLMILSNLIIPGHEEDNEDMARLFQRIVGPIITIFEEQTETTLSKLLVVPSTEISQILQPLRSVLNLPEDENSPIQLFHQSFRDYILNGKRCSILASHVDKTEAHENLFTKCIELMSKRLTRDLCNLGRPGTLIGEVEESIIKDCLPPDVQYACRYWVSHLKESKVALSDGNKVLAFLQKHLLHWLEAMSLIRQTSEGVISISFLESMITVSSSLSSQEHSTHAKHLG